jgi:phenylalanyl-tRNA synthetase beta chain
VPSTSRSADFFDAKGLFERLLEPWAEPGSLTWKPFHAEAFVAGAAARCETFDGRLLGVAGVVSEAERARRRLPEGVSAAEILVEAIPSPARRVRHVPSSAFPSIVADLSFSHARDLDWETLERAVSDLAPANLESLRLLDRYEGPGVGEGRVKTTLRLTFRSFERTLEQAEINRERDRVAAALAEKLSVQF